MVSPIRPHEPRPVQVLQMVGAVGRPYFGFVGDLRTRCYRFANLAAMMRSDFSGELLT